MVREPAALLTVVAVIVHRPDGVSTSVPAASRSPATVFSGPVGLGAPSDASLMTSAVLPIAALAPLKVRSPATGGSLTGMTVTPRETRLLRSEPSVAWKVIVRVPAVGSWLVLANRTSRKAVW